MKTKIVMSQVEITEKRVFITSEECSTCFCRVIKHDFPSLKELAKEVKALRKTLKEKKVKLYQTNTLKLLKEQEAYNRMVDEYNKTFDQLSEGWKVKLEKGIYTGYGSDKEYEVLRELKFTLDAMNYRNTIISEVLDVQSNVRKIQDDLNEGVEFVSVSV